MSPNLSVYIVIQAVNAKSFTGDTAGETSPMQTPAVSRPGVSGGTSDTLAAGTSSKSGTTANKPVFNSKKRQVKHFGLQPLQILASHICHQQSQ